MARKWIITFLWLCLTGILYVSVSSPKTQAETTSPAQTEQRTPNKLIQSFSPYLKQHAYNPIDWYPWGKEAMEKAQKDNKMVILSTGYATCYWCHVMERTVYNDKEVAAYMNEHFISIKLDREVRPDIDEIYMQASLLLSGERGWPNNMILTPDLKPAFAYGTLNKEQWVYVLRNAVDIWRTNQAAVSAKAQSMEKSLKRHFSGTQKASAKPIDLDKALYRFHNFTEQHYDARNGGFGAGSKYPDTDRLLYLLDIEQHFTDGTTTKKVKNTLDHMLSGGIHDHVGGGFHRYTTDPQWLSPHFEKMTYDQGLILYTLAKLQSKEPSPRYKNAADKLVSFMAKHMTAPNGGFYSAMDAQTESMEGAYYVWTYDDVKYILPDRYYELFQTHFGIKNIYHYPGHEYAEGGVLFRKVVNNEDDVEADITDILSALEHQRGKRTRPNIDKKIISSWNGIMILGLSEAALAFNENAYITKAKAAADFIIKDMLMDDGRLRRIYIDDKSYLNGFLEDYAWLARGFVNLYRVTEEQKYLDTALTLIETIDKVFSDGITASYLFSENENLIELKIKQGHDSGSLPSANAIIVHLFADLYQITKDKAWKDKAEALANAFAGSINKSPLKFMHMAHGMMRLNPEKQSKRTDAEKPDSPKMVDKDKPNDMESISKMDVKAVLLEDSSTPSSKKIKVMIDIDDGWYINSNPASLDSLIATAVAVQSETPSNFRVLYPLNKVKKTPLGKINIYKDRVKINTHLHAKEEIDEEKIRVLLQVQACKDEICYMPSNISLKLDKFEQDTNRENSKKN